MHSKTTDQKIQVDKKSYNDNTDEGINVCFTLHVYTSVLNKRNYYRLD